jgi:hypothetical protein
MPSGRTGPDDEIEPRERDERRLTQQSSALPDPEAESTATMPGGSEELAAGGVQAVVAAAPLAPEPWPLLWPAPLPPAAAGGHLEDPEWSRLLVGLASDSAQEVELPLAWRLAATQAAAFVETTASPPPPFGPDASGMGWSVTKEARLAESVTAADLNRASGRSGLVTMWHDEASRGLLDIVAARSVALEGPPVAVGYTLSDVVVELATRRWSDVAALYLVGFGREMQGLENVRYLSTAGDAAALLSREPFEPQGARCFVVAPMPTSDVREAELRRLLRHVEQTPATGVICCDTAVQAHCTWHLAAHRQTVRMEVRGRAGPAVVLTPRGWVQRTGPSMRLPARSVPPVSTAGAVREALVPGVSTRVARQRPAPGVDVLVLGPVQVEGANESFEGRPLLTELVVYLAFHPEGLLGEACAAALWPDRRVPLQTLSNRLHEVRRALGTMENGEPRLKRSDGRHLVSPDVRTDWWRFVALTGPESGPASWRQALALVRGRPFDGLARGDWAVFEGFLAAVEAAIVGIAVRLGEHLLEAADPLGAEWALRQGLLVAPSDERLYRLLMVACDDAGNRGGVESVLRSLAQVLDCSGDPLEMVHPETAALYRQLTGLLRLSESPESD